MHESLKIAAEAIRQADALLIGAGAGMGVDSGLPDFRGTEGFWRAYPPFQKAGLTFTDLAQPHWFRSDPSQAWGFYGHRRNLYRATMPHEGFRILRNWADRMSCGAFVFTSNVDGHFQKSGFSANQIVECHGSLELLQCIEGCTQEIWPAATEEISVDTTTFHASEPLPRCFYCGELARPNVLMFNDDKWMPRRTERQRHAYSRWLSNVGGKRLVIIELGAGLAVPTVRWECERQRGTLIRINPREASVRSDGIALPIGARDALSELDNVLSG